MNELDFLERLYIGARPDRWGWAEIEVGPFTVSTNGTAWTAKNADGKRVSLKAVMASVGKPA